MGVRDGIVILSLGVSLIAVGASAQRVERHVPDHDPSLVDGCTSAQLHMIAERLGDAIDVGAPLYNDGDHAGCYRTYEQAARAIEAALTNACPGPGRALREGRARAASLGTDTERAWAMRDAFDGLLYLLVRVGVR